MLIARINYRLLVQRRKIPDKLYGWGMQIKSIVDTIARRD